MTTTRLRLIALSVVAYSIGVGSGWILFHGTAPSASFVVVACSESAQDVADKCNEADRRWKAFQLKFPNSESGAKNDVALKSAEWERSQAWAQACEDVTSQLVEAIKSESSPTPKSSPKTGS